ncbi:MAG: hypothetical protein ACR2HH_10410 [Chthoniobacterales bacterium]
MTRLALLAIATVLVVSPGRLNAGQQPQMRPALLTNGKNSLINLIDTQRLFKEGQGDAVVRFDFGVSRHGEGYEAETYMRSDKSDKLAKEIIDKCNRSKFMPAVYKGEEVASMVMGTAIFGVVGGKPHLRIYLHQEPSHLKNGDDFISPQPVVMWNDKFNGFIYPEEGRFSGMVSVKLDVDANGNLLNTQVSHESMPGRGMGKAIMERIHTLHFVPAFSHGQAVASSTTWNLTFQGGGRGQSWTGDSN